MPRARTNATKASTISRAGPTADRSTNQGRSAGWSVEPQLAQQPGRELRLDGHAGAEGDPSPRAWRPA